MQAITLKGPLDASANSRAVLSVVFAPGSRPDHAALAALAQRGGLDLPFTVSHMSAPDDGWAELLCRGLTFDCRGLAPARPLPLLEFDALLGLADRPEGEVIGLAPGPHLAEAAGMAPVARILAGIGAGLAELPGVQAVGWNPAQSWMPPAYFAKVVRGWLANGPFPALGLTSLRRESDGAMVTVGLDFFTGQELRFPADGGLAAADIARIAVRLIHALLETEPLATPHRFTGPEGESVEVTPVGIGRQLRVTIRR